GGGAASTIRRSFLAAPARPDHDAAPPPTPPCSVSPCSVSPWSVLPERPPAGAAAPSTEAMPLAGPTWRL
ncbi:hypothetical protein JN535_18080, partial [Cellulosimicrobium cellulans]|nr:hypothetical protein [Cellulosimicrobium cellulans]